MLLPAEAEANATRAVFVASSRAGGRDTPLAEARSEQLGYYRLDIAIPPGRRPGSIPIATHDPDPAREFAVADWDVYAGARPFRAELRRALSRLAPEDRELVIYVHGFNNTFAEGVLRIAQLSHDLQLPGVAVHYSWPSAGNPLGYAYDHDSALFARDGLEDLLRIADASGARRVVLVAHSIGSLITMETLRQMAIARPGSPRRTVNAVILVSPDIDVDVFRAQARRIGALPDPFFIFTSRRDRALRLSARLTGQSERLGNLEDPSRLGEFDVTLIDVTAFGSGISHFVPGDSPALIGLLSQVAEVDAAFDRDRAGRAGLLPGTVLTVQNLTQVILTPLAVGAN